MNFSTLVDAVLTPVEDVRSKASDFAATMWKRYALSGGPYADAYLATEVSQLLMDHEMAILKRNAPPVPDAKVTLSFGRVDDPEITCIYCGKPGVEYGLTVRRPGERALVGLHEKCRRAAPDGSVEPGRKDR